MHIGRIVAGGVAPVIHGKRPQAREDVPCRIDIDAAGVTVWATTCGPH